MLYILFINSLNVMLDDRINIDNLIRIRVRIQQPARINRISKSIVARRAARNDFINSNPSHVVARSRIFEEERESLSSRKADPFVTWTKCVCFAVRFVSLCIMFSISRRCVRESLSLAVFSIDQDRIVRVRYRPEIRFHSVIWLYTMSFFD